MRSNFQLPTSNVERGKVTETQNMNSREKGKRGERQWRDELRANGYQARRGQQFSGSPESPDVICDGLPWAHFEVKLVERLDLYAAMEQARHDSGGRAPFVAHRKNFWRWLVTMDAETFFRFLRGDFTEGNKGNGGSTPHPSPNLCWFLHSSSEEGKCEKVMSISPLPMTIFSMMASTIFRLSARGTDGQRS